MKYLFGFLLIFFTFGANSQTSYDFVQPVPPGLPIVKTLDKRYHGVYKSYRNDRVIEIGPKGIFAKNGVVSQLSRETIRESSKLFVRDNYVFGVMDGDSLPCSSDSLYYYFIIPTVEDMISLKSKNVLVKISNNTFVINFKENNTYVPCLITFTGEEMRIQYFDYDFETTVFDDIPVAKSAMIDSMPYKTLKPSQKQFVKMDFSEIFGKEILYKKAD